MTKVIYLANAYSSFKEDPDAAKVEMLQRRVLESYVAGTLFKRYGHAFILPIALSASMADICTLDTGFSQWKAVDEEFINRSDEVWVLVSNGWKESVGVQAEIKHAKQHNKPVYYIYPEIDFAVLNIGPTRDKVGTRQSMHWTKLIENNRRN